MGEKTFMISAVILTKNEEKHIIDCIESLSFCDEILVIDDNSQDLTVDVAKKAGAHIYQHQLENNFASARNFGLEKAKGEWVLFVDADERLSKALQNEIIYAVSKNDDVDGYFLMRQDYFHGKKLQFGETAQVRLLRLAKKGKGIWRGTVHEVWNIKGKTAQLETPLDHNPHESINDFLLSINFYTDLRAKELFHQGVTVKWFDLILYPKVKFIQNYIFKMGFRDGVEGMIMALMMSFHSFLVRGKLWQLWDQKRQ